MSTTPAAWPNVILINETISYTRWISLLFFSFFFFSFPSFSLSVWTSPFFPHSLSHCFFFFFPLRFFFPDWCQKVPDQLVAPASCEKPFYVLLQVIWRGTFSLSTRALICSRFFPITLQPCATWFYVSQHEIFFFIFLSLTVATRCTFLFKNAWFYRNAKIDTRAA